MRILVTGSNGMLGTAVKKVFIDHDLVLTGRSDLDVCNVKQVMSFNNKKLDIIFHLAAETDLNAAETNHKKVYKVNLTGTENILKLAKKLNVPLVYISTAMIYDGKKKVYSEKDNPNPTNHYGNSKFLGEKAVLTYEKHYILRSGWGMGGGPKKDKKFVNKIYQQVINGAKKLYGIKDIYGNPTYTIDFAKTLKNLVESKAKYGIYNCPGKGTASRYDVLFEFIKLLGLSKKIEVIPLSIKEYLTIFPSKFPYIKNEVLSLKKLEKSGLSAMRVWQEALIEYAQEYKIRK